ncbi:hypothetical protein PR048_024393, partial [Dryococelus australis]
MENFRSQQGCKNTGLKCCLVVTSCTVGTESCRLSLSWTLSSSFDEGVLYHYLVHEVFKHCTDEVLHHFGINKVQRIINFAAEFNCLTNSELCLPAIQQLSPLVSGRLQQGEFLFEVKHPVLLPKLCLAELLVDRPHLEFLLSDPSTLHLCCSRFVPPSHGQSLCSSCFPSETLLAFWWSNPHNHGK